MKALYILWLSSLLVVLPSVAAPPVLVLNNTNEAPFTTDSHDGYVDLIATEAFRRAGLSLRLVKDPPERGIINANAGDLDGDLLRIAGLDAQYPNLLRVPEKLMDWEFSAFGTPKSKAPRWEALGAGTTGHIRGWKIYEQQLAGVADATAVIEAPQLFQLLASKRIEAALYERWMGLALMRQMNIHGFIAHSPPLAKREMFIYLHKRHARHVPLLAKALVDMKAEGFYRMAYQKSLAPYLTPAQY